MPLFYKQFILLKVTGTCFLAATCFLTGIAIVEGSSSHNILILNSYHQGEEWSDNEIDGILSTLTKAYPILTPADDGHPTGNAHHSLQRIHDGSG